MQNFETAPMPEGFGLQVKAPHGWHFRHCGTLFNGDMCPDCAKTGFIAAAHSLTVPVAVPSEVILVPTGNSLDTLPVGDLTLVVVAGEVPATALAAEQIVTDGLTAASIGEASLLSQEGAKETSDVPEQDDAAPETPVVPEGAVVLSVSNDPEAGLNVPSNPENPAAGILLTPGGKGPRKPKTQQ